jgi:hypothetical protein
MRMRTRSLLTALVVSMAAAPAAAQSRGIELGADIGLGVTFGGGSTFFTAMTPTSLRFGLPAGELLTFEPRLSFVLASGEGETFTSLSLQPALMYALKGSSRNGPYLALLPSIDLSSGFGESESQFGAGAGIGVRMSRGEQFGLRVEGQFIHSFENDDFGSSNEINVLLGASFFTH